MDQSPAAFFYKADATDNGYRGATGFRGFGDFSVDVLLLTGAGGGGENLLPTCVLCHVSRCTPRIVDTHAPLPHDITEGTITTEQASSVSLQSFSVFLYSAHMSRYIPFV